MKYQYEFPAVVALTPEKFHEICPNTDPADKLAEKSIKDFFQNVLNDFISGKYVSREKYEQDVSNAKYSATVNDGHWDK